MKDKYSELTRYYEKSDWLYKYFWYGKKSLGLHFGIDGAGVNNLDDAVVQQYEIIILEGKIERKLRVLDAGCGVGGAAIYIAEKTGAKVQGISLVESQIESARNNAKERGVEERVKFDVMDYTKTSFPDNYFDIVYGIESVCYSFPKSLFLKEAWRILKKGGKLIIADGYTTRVARSREEQQILEKFCEGWKLAELIEISKMKKSILDAGFTKLKIIDVTDKLEFSKARFRWLMRVGQFFQFLPGVRDNVLAIRNLLAGLRRGLMGYFVIVVRK